MKAGKSKNGLTLLEILVSVSIIAILTVVVIGLHSKVEHKTDSRLLEKTFLTLNGALDEFRNYQYRYANSNYSGFVFPVDCNGFDKDQLCGELENVLVLNPGEVVIDANGTHDSNDSGCEVMYWFLDQVPSCRESLGRLDKTLVTNVNRDRRNMTIEVDGRTSPLMRVIDPWGQTLRYDYYDEETKTFDSRRNFPVITSSGPDKQFGTADDIRSR